MKKIIKYLLVISIFIQLFPLHIQAEETVLDKITSVVENKVKSYASSIYKANSDTNAALTLAKHGISGNGNLKLSEKHDMNSTLWNSKLGQAAFTEGISEAITKLQQLPLDEIKVGFCVNWGSNAKQYFYNVYAVDESIYFNGNEKFTNSTNNYDKNLTWIAGSTNSEFTIKEKTIKDKTIVYEISYTIFDDFDFENGTGSLPKQILFLLSTKLFKEFKWETKGKFEIEVYNSCDHTSSNYHLKLNGNQLVSDTTDIYEKNSSKIKTSQYNKKNTFFELDKTIHLFHNREWVIEYTIKNPARLFAMSPCSKKTVNFLQIMSAFGETAFSFLFNSVTDDSDLIFQSYRYRENSSINYKHRITVRLENEIDSKGNNKIHILLIDNDLDEIVVDSYLDDYQKIINYKFSDCEDSMTLNGKDIFISYIGTTEYHMLVDEFDLKVWENGEDYFKDVVIKSTCESKGYTKHTCSNCGYTFNDSNTKALGHVFNNYISNGNGTSTSKCDRCNETDTKNDVIYGDVNNDGNINNQDRLVLTRALAKWNGYSVNEINADLNQDGVVNNQDRMILTRHLAKWQGYEIPYQN